MAIRIPLLCRMCGWEMISVASDTVHDYIYDTDTRLVCTIVR